MLRDVCAYEILGLISGEVYSRVAIRKAFLRASKGICRVQYGQMHLPIHHPLLSGGGGMCLPILH